MEKEFQNDDMEAFFRKAFGELGDAPSEDGWDTPSDDVWAGIQRAIPGPKPAWWTLFRLWAATLFAIGLLLVLLSGLWGHYRKLESKIEQQALANEKLQLVVDSLQRQLGRQEDSAAPKVSIESGKAMVAGEKLAPDISRPLGSQGVRSRGSLSGWDEEKIKLLTTEGQESGQSGKNSALPEQAPMVIVGDKPVSPTPSEGLFARVAMSPLLPVPLPGLSVSKVVAGSNEPTLKISLDLIRPVRSKPGFYLGAYTAWNYTSRDLFSKKMGADQPVRPIFEAREQGQGSMEFGVRAGLQLSRRWALESGVGAFSIRQQSRQLFRIIFDPSREQPDGSGVLESTYALAVPSAFGESQIEVGLRRAASQQIIPGEAIGLEISSRQQLRFVSIPLVARYDLLSGRFGLGVKGGLAFNFLQATSLQTAVQIHRSGLRAPVTRVRQRFSEVRDTNLDYILGLSARYRLWAGLEAELQPAYRRNLQPITARQDFLTRSYALGLQLGVNYRF